MDKIILSLEVLFPIIALLVLGYLLKRFAIVDENCIAGMKNIVAKILLPVLVFKCISSVTIAMDSVVIFIVVFSEFMIALGIGYLARKFYKPHEKYFPFLIGTQENGMAGYALLTALVGQEMLYELVKIDFACTIYGYVIYLTLLSVVTSGSKPSGKELAISLVKSPIIISLAVGIVGVIFGFGQWVNASRFADVYNQTLNTITAPITPIILLTVGYNFTVNKKILPDVLKTIVSRYVLWAAMGAIGLFILDKTVGVSKLLFISYVLVHFLPPTYVLPIYVKEEEHVDYISATLSLSLIVTLIVVGLLSFVKL